jgi:phosphatidylethanolamine/phosphatidyl-N-methylethanolamine N-methyltransferase
MDPISQDNVIRTYRFYAPIYDWVFGGILEPGRRALTESVRRLQPVSLLEVGVGTGLTLGKYPATTRIVGIDLSPEMLKVARTRAGKLNGYDIRLEAMNAEAMTFPDGAFDCVVLPYVLSVTPNPEKLVAEARRVCRKDGTILIVNHFRGSRFWWLLERLVRSLARHIGFRSDFSFDEQVRDRGLEIVSVRTVNFMGLSRLIEIRNA